MRRRMFLTAAIAGLTGCRKRSARRLPPPPVVAVRLGERQRGIASWYGHPYHGRRSASGEVYDMDQLTAAHLTLPFHTRVLVRNLDNGRSIQVRINDRGPFWEGRIIDLSREAARTIEMIGPGLANVEIEIVGLPETARAAGPFAVQIGAFREQDRAQNLRNQFEKRYGVAQLVLRRGNPDLWRVLVGRQPDLASAEQLAAGLRKQWDQAFVVRLDSLAAAVAR